MGLLSHIIHWVGKKIRLLCPKRFQLCCAIDGLKDGFEEGSLLGLYLGIDEGSDDGGDDGWREGFEDGFEDGSALGFILFRRLRRH
jgi:hypothetical protein